MAYSMDLRTRTVDAIRREKLSQREAAERFGIGLGTVNHWLKKQKGGDLRAARPGPTSAAKLTDEQFEDLGRWVQERPGIASREAAEKLGHVVCEGHIRRIWLAMGLSFKKTDPCQGAATPRRGEATQAVASGSRGA